MKGDRRVNIARGHTIIVVLALIIARRLSTVATCNFHPSTTLHTVSSLM